MNAPNKIVYIRKDAIEDWIRDKVIERGGIDGVSSLSAASQLLLLGELVEFLDRIDTL